MKINFFSETCQEKPIAAELFGLCDNQDGSKAYANVNDSYKWIATVKNEKKLQIVFTAVDKCLIKDNELKGQGRCDGLLTTQQHLYFVELKDQNSNWTSDALIQLESTIALFKENHNILDYRNRKAFACNKKHKGFKRIDNEQNLRFFRKHNIRLDVQTDIIVL